MAVFVFSLATSMLRILRNEPTTVEPKTGDRDAAIK
jgi:hypothetical protein